jgi:SAM-dependent methyltransferase
MKCRHCKSFLYKKILDLGTTSPSNAYLKNKDIRRKENLYPLRLYVCENCFLVQIHDFVRSEDLFTAEYAYFSSSSKTFLKYTTEFVKKIINDFKLDKNSFVIEIASNDGYLLKNFLAKKIPCLGIEPTKSTFLASKKLKINAINDFFSSKLADNLSIGNKKADIVIANNVYAHIPDINDFTIGIKKILKKNGVVTLEFHHVLNLIKYNLFDIVYHEHFSYLSLGVVNKIFRKFNLKVFDVKKIIVHGGSLRVYGCHADDPRNIKKSVTKILKEEIDYGLNNINTYNYLQKNAEKVKNELVRFLKKQKSDNKKVIAYGAAAKGNTLLNFCNIKSDLIEFVCDISHSKKNKYLPKSHIPIKSPLILNKINFDFILILPWNLKKEIIQQLSSIKKNFKRFNIKKC